MPIYDVSYRHLEDGGAPRAPRALRFLPITAVALRLFFRRRVARLLALFALGPFGLAFAFLVAPRVLDAGQRLREVEEMQGFLEFGPGLVYVYLVQLSWIFQMLFCALAGAGLIANDLRANALEIYFSRPLTRFDYLFGKLLAVETVLLGVTLAPCLVLWLVDVLLDDREGHLWRQLPLLPRVAAASLVETLPYALLVLALSAIVRSGRVAILAFAGIVLVTLRLGPLLARWTGEREFGLIALDHCVQRLILAVLGGELGPVAATGQIRLRLQDVPLVWPILVLMGVAVLCVAVLARRVRAVRVVAS